MRLKVGFRYECNVPDGGVFRVLAEYQTNCFWYWLLEEGRTDSVSEPFFVKNEDQVKNFVPFSRELAINWDTVPSGYNELRVERCNSSHATNKNGDVWRIKDEIMDVIAPGWRLFYHCSYLRIPKKGQQGEPTTSILGSIQSVVENTPELSSAVNNGTLSGAFFGISGIYHLKGKDALVIGYHLGSESAGGDVLEIRLLRIFEDTGISKVGKNSYAVDIPAWYDKDNIRHHVCAVLKHHGAKILNEEEGSFGIVTGDPQTVQFFEALNSDTEVIVAKEP